MSETGTTEGGQRPGAGVTVQLFPTCLVNDFYPGVGIAVVEVLERYGVTVELPDRLTCCGQPAYNAGFRDEAARVAAFTLDRLAATEGPIVVPSGSCADMLVHQTLELFRDDPERLATAQAVGGRVYEFSQFLVEVLGVGVSTGDRSGTAGEEDTTGGEPAGTRREEGAAAPDPKRVAYHPSCHLSRGLGVTRPPGILLERVAGACSVPFDDQDECCGFGGLFSVKQPEISGAMLDKKCNAIERSGARALVSCDMGCLMNIEGGLRRRGVDLEVRHLAEILRDSLETEDPAQPEG